MGKEKQRKLENILVYRWKAYNYTDVIENFKGLGYEVDAIFYSMDQYDEDEGMAELLRKTIRAKTYAFVFSMNYFPVISDVCQEMGIRYLCWTCDSPLIAMYHESVYNDVNRIFTFDKTNELEFRAMGVDRIFYLPLGVDVDRVTETLQRPVSSPAEFTNTVSFVGSLYEKNSYDRLEPKLTEFLQGYFAGVMEIQSRQYGRANIMEDALTEEVLEQLQELLELEKTDRSFSDVGLVFQITALGFKVAQIQRVRDLVMLSKRLPVSIYSNSNVFDLDTLEYKGGVDYWTEMPFVFHNSKVNLNFTIPNIKSGIPLRVWDVLGAGGFLLTNFQAELPMYFENGKHLLWFSSEEELEEKAAYYCDPRHESRRIAIAHAGYELVAKEHTYRKRLEKMLELAQD
ncbi:MAG: glycosyltransferase [Lachnospiraceae bacterium]|nr:glycosyltransferase [Lachnospiraceae bacterium]